MSYMITLYFLPLSTLNAIKHRYMIWAAVLSIAFLRERFSFIISCSVLLALFGLTLTSKPDIFVSIQNGDHNGVVIPFFGQDQRVFLESTFILGGHSDNTLSSAR